MKISRLPLLMFRTPQFSFTDELEDVWEELKSSIAYSSPDFFENIKMISTQELDKLDPKTSYSIWKYFNRARWRPIPYGSFASFGTLPISQDKNTPEIIIAGHQQLNRFINWPFKREINWQGPQLFNAETLLCTNSSWYQTSTGIRFLARNEETFEIVEIQNDDFIIEILQHCDTPVSFETLQNLILSEYETTQDELLELLNGLIELHLLHTSLSPNIIGPDYFSRIGYSKKKSKSDYLLAERKTIQGSLPQKYVHQLEPCVNYLNGIHTQIENPGLRDFKAAYLNRFDQKLLPLIIALDPEMGCGYQELAQTSEHNTLIEDLKKPAQSSRNNLDIVQWPPFKKQLLNEIINANGNKKHIILLKDPITQVVREVPKLANSFSALFTLTDNDQIVLNSLGGATANSLLGRFTLASEEIETLSKDIADIECSANPEIIFFDIAYLSEEKVDNINRRSSTYDFELPILCYSCSKNPIAMNDIFVTVRGKEIILYSKKFKKRLVPRLSSAYNYSRSDLAIYRFLCDLQHQELQTQLLFDILTLLPDLNFYPRIQYKNIILSLAQWKIEGKDLNLKLKNPEAIEHLRRHLSSMEVPRFFTAGNGDQYLCFDQMVDRDLLAFNEYLKKNKVFYVRELLRPAADLVKDTAGKPYMTQFLISLYHREQLYIPFLEREDLNNSIVRKNIPPGKDWLYLEIYCHPQRIDNILLESIEVFINEYKHNFNCWFFIRYNAPDHHIRFRVQMKPEANNQSCLADFMELIEPHLLDGIISDVQIKTYNRETERYGADMIENIESLFCLDSEYVLTLLCQETTIFQLYRTTINLIISTYNSLDLDEEQQLAWSKTVQDSFVIEHQLAVPEFKKLNMSYATFKETIFDSWDLSEKHFLFQDALQELLVASPLSRRLSLCTDLFHMHINRLFTSNQRTHELVIYYFLYKELLMRKKIRQ